MNESANDARNLVTSEAASNEHPDLAVREVLAFVPADGDTEAVVLGPRRVVAAWRFGCLLALCCRASSLDQSY